MVTEGLKFAYILLFVMHYIKVMKRKKMFQFAEHNRIFCNHRIMASAKQNGKFMRKSHAL